MLSAATLPVDVAAPPLAANLQALPSSFTLSLLLLACWQAREPVNPLDIVRWALNGELPFLSFAADSRDLLEPFHLVLTAGFLIPTGTPGTSWLFVATQGFDQRRLD